jgi:hypothetical protein
MSSSLGQLITETSETQSDIAYFVVPSPHYDRVLEQRAPSPTHRPTSKHALAGVP